MKILFIIPILTLIACSESKEKIEQNVKIDSLEKAKADSIAIVVKEKMDAIKQNTIQ